MPEPSTLTRKAAPIPEDVTAALHELVAAADLVYELTKAQLGELHPISEALLEVWASVDAIEKAAARENWGLNRNNGRL